MHLFHLTVFLSTASALLSDDIFLRRRNEMILQARTPADRPRSNPPNFPMFLPTGTAIRRSPSPEKGSVGVMTTGPVSVQSEKNGVWAPPVLHTSPQTHKVSVTARQSASIHAKTLEGGTAAVVATGARIVEASVKGKGMVSHNSYRSDYASSQQHTTRPGELKIQASVGDDPRLQHVSAGTKDGGEVRAEVRPGIFTDELPPGIPPPRYYHD